MNFKRRLLVLIGLSALLVMVYKLLYSLQRPQGSTATSSILSRIISAWDVQ